MAPNIDLEPQTEAWIRSEALQRGVIPADRVRRVIEERAADIGSARIPEAELDAGNLAAIAYLDRKLRADATNDPDESRKASEEYD